jgi:hypothetical protein
MGALFFMPGHDFYGSFRRPCQPKRSSPPPASFSAWTRPFPHRHLNLELPLFRALGLRDDQSVVGP